MVNNKLYSKATLVIVVALLLLSACNPYKRLPQRPPLTAKDSTALLSRCVGLLPIDTTKAPSLNIAPVPADSSAYYRELADSISRIKRTVEERLQVKYKDTCTSAIAIYQDGFNTGYKMGEYQGNEKAQSQNHKTVSKLIRNCDSLHNITVKRLKQGYDLQLLAAVNARTVAQTAAEKYRTKYSRLVKWTWGLSIAFLLAVIVCILLWKFKRQAKTANNIVNDVRSIAK